MNDFLSKLQKVPVTSGSQAYTKPDAFFRLSCRAGKVYLGTVDKSMQPILPNADSYVGETGRLLKLIERIREQQQYQISWDEHPEEEISLTENPFLTHHLVRCPRLVSSQGTPITYQGEATGWQLLLKNNAKQITPALQMGNEPVADFACLSECHVLIGNAIYAIPDLGDNFESLPVFLESFQANRLCEYLSVFFSYIKNLPVACEAYSVELSEQTVTPSLAIVFEKVDTDKALYLHLTETMPGLPTDFLRQFDLNRVAILDGNQIVLKRLQSRPLEDAIGLLRKQIMQSAASRQEQKEVYQDGGFFIIPSHIAGNFLLHSLPVLLKHFTLMGAEKLQEYKIKPMQPKLNLKLSSGIDFLDGEVDVDLEQERFTLQQLLQQYHKDKYIQLSDGNRAIMDDGYMRKLERIFRNPGKGGKVKVSFFDLPEIEELLNGEVAGAAFQHHRKLYEGFNQLAKQTLKLPRLKAKLRSYQQEGVKWMKYLYDNNLGGCLADDMGLGKTVQTIGMLTSIYPGEELPALIVMPRSLLFNWQAELQRFAPKLTVYTYYGNSRSMEEAIGHQVILTTYAIVRNDIEAFRQQEFQYVILDESQNIKNISAQVTQSALLLKAKHKLALSGTPIENHLGELYSLFRFLNPALFGTLDEFNKRYAYPIQKENDKDVLLSLRKKIFPFMLRRLKKDVLAELPDRIEQTLYIEMEKEQADFYEQRRKHYLQQVKASIAASGVQKSQFVMFQALNELRRIASVPESLSDGYISSPKVDVLMENLVEAVANGHKVVVFFNFIAGIELVGDQLERNGIDYACMTGATHDRQSVVNRFQTDPKCSVLLMTLKTGGVGLNLTVADTVFIFEPWWNKAAEEQAINRLHRFGQTAKVLSFSLIVKNSIEEKIRLLQQQKAELFEGLIGNDTTSSKQLSEEDIEYILG